MIDDNAWIRDRQSQEPSDASRNKAARKKTRKKRHTNRGKNKHGRVGIRG